MAASKAAERFLDILQGKTLVMGIGNPMLGDDAAGPRLIELLQKAGVEGLILIDAGPAPERHFGEIEAAAPDAVLLVDAVDWGAAAGEVAFFEEDSLPQRLSSTHDVSMRLIMRYIREQTGAKVGLVGIQPAQAAFGAGLSPQVEDAVNRLAKSLSAQPSEKNANLVGVGAWTV
jgi:hydrogenase 3 maturation protease